jgi:hypothetical protein
MLSYTGLGIILVSVGVTGGMLWAIWESHNAEDEIRLGHFRTYLSLGGHVGLDEWLYVGGTEEEWRALGGPTNER